MAAAYPAPDPVQSTFLIPGSNTPGNGVQVFFYTNLTSTKTTVYKDSSTSTAWSNPIVLDSGGNLPSAGQVYVVSGETLTVKYAPSNDTDPPGSVYRTLNDIQGLNDVNTSISTAEWVTGPTPTFINTTSFSLVGNQTATFTVGRRVKTTNTGGTVYSRITGSVFGAVTTVTVVNDSGVLDSGLSAVSYSLLSSVNSAIPALRDNVFTVADGTDPTKTANFELSGITSSTGVVLSVQNTSGVLAFTSEFQYQNVASSNGRLMLPPGYIQGYVPSIPTLNSITVSTGATVNSSNAHNLLLSLPITKSITSSWAVSSGGGGLLDAGAISTNIWYYGHAFKSTTHGWVDIGYSSSFAAPALPTGYTVKSKSPVAVSFMASGTSTPFKAYEKSGGVLEYWWLDPPMDYASTNPGSTAVSVTLRVPTGFPVSAIMNAGFNDGNAALNALYLSDLSLTDLAASNSSSPLGLSAQDTAAAAHNSFFQARIMTNTSSQIRSRMFASDANVTTRIVTLGFEWSRIYG